MVANARLASRQSRGANLCKMEYAFHDHEDVLDATTGLGLGAIMGAFDLIHDTFSGNG